MLARLRDMSGISVGEFMSGRSMRSHPIDWLSTTRPDGFNLNDDLKEFGAWQFQVTGNAHGRVHGLLIDNVFFVVWLDPDHRLYK
ncbi:MAG: hypothetical protein HQK57_02385 [Deltaproteobacteria bacterium]|nr:hypothetical protein [Deltaproteobacteria bacterium]MBF0526210.1 hypothetical protein [Deltaproteobacteria bacterium]